MENPISNKKGVSLSQIQDTLTAHACDDLLSADPKSRVGYSAPGLGWFFQRDLMDSCRRSY
jgi:hypothetical protein